MNLKRMQAVTVLSFCLYAATLAFGAVEAAPKCPKTIKVVLKKVIGRDFLEYKVFDTKVNPQVWVVRSKVDGKITDLKVTGGDLISKELEIVVIDNARAAEITSLDNEIDKWSRTLKTRRGWKVRSANAEQQAERKIQELNEKLQEVKATLPDYRIMSPAGGTVKTLYFKKGDMVTAGAVIAEIENNEVMYGDLTVEEAEKALFLKGQEIAVKIDELNTKAKAEVVDIAADKIIIGLANKDKQVKAGFTIKFKVQKEEHKNAVVIPKTALSQDEQGYYVFKAVETRIYKTHVEIGVMTLKDCLVTSGLAVGEIYVAAEVLSVDQGTIKESFECVKDNVKIKPMVKDEGSGTFVKGKIEAKKVIKKHAVKKEKPEEPVEVEKERPVPAGPSVNVLTIGVGGGLFHVNQTSWGEVFSKGNPVFGGKVGYQFMDKFEIFGEYNYMSATGSLVPTNDEITSTTMVISFGGRYLFKGNNMFRPYVGLSGVMTSFKSENPFATTSDSAIGPSLQVGTYFNITPNLVIDLALRYDRVILKNDEYGTEGDMSGGRLLLFITYKFNL